MAEKPAITTPVSWEYCSYEQIQKDILHMIKIEQQRIKCPQEQVYYISAHLMDEAVKDGLVKDGVVTRGFYAGQRVEIAPNLPFTGGVK